MATIPSFRTWVTSEIVTAAYLNTNVRDAGNFFLARVIAQLRQTVSQTLTSSVWAGITYDAEDIDNDGGHSTSTNTSRYTPQTTGWFLGGGGVGFTSLAAPNARRGCRWAVTGTAVNGSANQFTPGTAGGTSGSLAARSQLVSMTAGVDYLELQGFFEGGGTLTTNVTAENQSSMTVAWIGTG